MSLQRALAKSRTYFLVHGGYLSWLGAHLGFRGDGDRVLGSWWAKPWVLDMGISVICEVEHCTALGPCSTAT